MRGSRSPSGSTARGLGEDFQVGAENDLDTVSVLRGIRLHNLNIHDVNGQDKKDGDGSAGIQISVRIAGLDANSEPAPGAIHRRTTFERVTIENNIIDKVSRSGIITWSDWKNRTELGDGIGYGSSAKTPFTLFSNVVIRNNTLSAIGGDGIVPHMTEGALVERNTVKGFNVTSTGYNVGMWTWNGDNTLYQYNDVSGGVSTRDGNAFDFDHASRGIVYQYNFSHDNEGGTLLFCADGRAGGVYDGVFRYNVSQNDHYKLFTVCGGANLSNMKVYNNTFYIAPGLSTTVLDAQGGANDVTFSNNIFYNLGSGGYIKKSSWTYSHNVYFGNNIPSSSTIPDANASRSDPRLLSPGLAGGVDDLQGYKLRNGSDAIGTGAVIPNAAATDLWGNPVSSTHPNRGAYAGPGETGPQQDNLLSNPGFELGTASWTPWNASAVAGNARSGANAARITGGPGSLEQTVTGLTPRTTYVLSAYVKTSSGEIRVGAKSYGGPERYAASAAAGYTQTSVSFTTGADSTSAIVYLYKPGSRNTSFGDDFTLTEASAPSS